MKALADYVHGNGLKLGIYSSPAAKTCGLRGQLGHETEDAEIYAEWGIDNLKYDSCQPTASLEDLKAAYAKMRDAPNKTRRRGKPMSTRSRALGGRFRRDLALAIHHSPLTTVEMSQAELAKLVFGTLIADGERDSALVGAMSAAWPPICS
jgi:hypothetical protein